MPNPVSPLQCAHTPARLQRIADQAALSGNLHWMHPADRASHASAPWDELRVWDPGDLGKGGGDELDIEGGTAVR